MAVQHHEEGYRALDLQDVPQSPLDEVHHPIFRLQDLLQRSSPFKKVEDRPVVLVEAGLKIKDEKGQRGDDRQKRKEHGDVVEPVHMDVPHDPLRAGSVPEEDLVDPDPQCHDEPQNHEAPPTAKGGDEGRIPADLPGKLHKDPGSQKRDDHPFSEEVAKEGPGRSPVTSPIEGPGHRGHHPQEKGPSHRSVVVKGRDKGCRHPEKDQDDEEAIVPEPHGQPEMQGQNEKPRHRHPEEQGQGQGGDVDRTVVGEAPFEETVGHETGGGQLQEGDHQKRGEEGEGDEGSKEKIVPDPGEGAKA